MCGFFFFFFLFFFGLWSPVGCDIQVCMWCGGGVIRVGGCKEGLVSPCRLPELSLPRPLALTGNPFMPRFFNASHITWNTYSPIIMCVCIYIYKGGKGESIHWWRKIKMNPSSHPKSSSCTRIKHKSLRKHSRYYHIEPIIWATLDLCVTIWTMYQTHLKKGLTFRLKVESTAEETRTFPEAPETQNTHTCSLFSLQ